MPGAHHSDRLDAKQIEGQRQGGRWVEILRPATLAEGMEAVTPVEQLIERVVPVEAEGLRTRAPAEPPLILF